MRCNKDNSYMLTNPWALNAELLMCIEHAAWHVNLGIILTQQGILKDLDNLFDTSGTNLKLGAKFRDEFDYFAFIFFQLKWVVIY